MHIHLKLLVIIFTNEALGTPGQRKFQEQVIQKLQSLKEANFPGYLADEIFFHTLTYFAPVKAESAACRNDSVLYLEAALNGELWALRMLDASTKMESGSLENYFQNMGNYEECLDVESPRNFVGKYCLVEFSDFFQHRMSNNSQLNPRYDPFGAFVSLCVPSSCTHRDVEVHTGKSLNSSIHMSTTSCSTRYREHMQVKDYAALFLLLIILALVMVATVLDFLSAKYNKDMNLRAVSSFSLYKNWKKLTSTNQSHLSPLNGLRFIATVWVVIGDRLFINMIVPNLSGGKREFYIQKWIMANHFSLNIGVDIFFLLSGLLVAFNFFKSKENGESFSILRFYLHRYIRLTPMVALLLLINSSVFYYFGDGPIWKNMAGLQRDQCSEQWFPNIFYVSNYYLQYPILNTCLPQMWYLCADMQLYILSPLLLFALCYKPKHTSWLTIIYLVITTLVSFLDATYKKLKAGPIFTVKENNEISFGSECTKIHLSAGTYFIGMILGLSICRFKQGILKINLPKGAVKQCWFLSTSMITIILYSTAVFQSADDSRPQILDTLYIALSRPMFSLAIAWILFACISGHGGKDGHI
uniref:Nose resistant-to-fluoxetine protein N-terminal domain-containing protein n=1 Tax=Clastoptera arizonana TaxID=38151 RepID=A0A1B6EC68_9HEMI